MGVKDAMGYLIGRRCNRNIRHHVFVQLSKVTIMKKEVFDKAKEIWENIRNLENEINRVEETDTIYYKTPDMDGGYTPGHYCEFYEQSRGHIKEAIKKYYQESIEKLKKQFDEL